MKKLFLLLVFSFIAGVVVAQVERLKESPIYIDDTLVVVGVNAKTTDKELLEIRTKLLKFTTIRFIEFDVIRETTKSKYEEGDIQFISMEVDCRDGYVGKISHSFEPGDKSIQGFYRDYSKNTFRRAFFIGALADKYIALKRTEEIDKDNGVNIENNFDRNDNPNDNIKKKSLWYKIKNIFF